MTRQVRSTELSAAQVSAHQQPPARHLTIRVSPRLVIGILAAVLSVAVAAGVGLTVQLASKARVVDATKATTAHSGSVISATLGSFRGSRQPHRRRLGPGSPSLPGSEL